MGTLKCVCSYLSRDIRANQLEHTLLRVPMNKLMEDQMKEIPQNLKENAMDLKTASPPLKIVEISQLL